MSDLEAHFSEGQKKRRRRKRFLVIAGVFGIIYLFVFVILLVFTRFPVFRIREVKVFGNTTVSEEAVRDLYTMAIGRSNAFVRWSGMRNIVIAPVELPADILRLVPAIRSAHIEKRFHARNIEITVEERAPFGIWCLEPRIKADVHADKRGLGIGAGSTSTQMNADIMSDNPRLDPQKSVSDECWWFDIEGVIFKRAVMASGNLIPSVQDVSGRALGLNDAVLDEGYFKNFLSVLHILDSAGLSLQTTALTGVSADELAVETYSGPKLYFSLRFPPDGTLAVIQNLQTKPDFQKLQYIDFRVEKRTYYR